MTPLEALQAAQFVTVKDKRFAVIPADEWDALIDWLEDLEDRKIVEDALEKLKAVGGDRSRAEWLKWDDVAGDL
jgi:PHD/YefM family antitoxin component YafN of YafNO toxin-antitoxin module